MVSQYTWPNFRGGADRDGVRILIQQQNFEEDVVYGKTKIFVRSPQTLFMLEQVCVCVCVDKLSIASTHFVFDFQARARLIPGIVIFLQKLWRGTVCRRRYKKLLAAKRIVGAYRRFKMRSYLKLLSSQLRYVHPNDSTVQIISCFTSVLKPTLEKQKNKYVSTK